MSTPEKSASRGPSTVTSREVGRSGTSTFSPTMSRMHSSRRSLVTRRFAFGRRTLMITRRSLIVIVSWGTFPSTPEPVSRTLYSLLFFLLSYAFGALTLLVGHQEEHLVRRIRVMRCWCDCLSGERCNRFMVIVHGPVNAAVIPKQIIFASMPQIQSSGLPCACYKWFHCIVCIVLKFGMAWLFWYPDCLGKEAIKQFSVSMCWEWPLNIFYLLFLS